MKSQTIKEDILPVLVILFTALLFSFKISFSATPAPTTLMHKAFAPVLPAVASFEDAVETTTVSMENALRNLVPSIPSEASFDDNSIENNDSLIQRLAPVMPTEADFE